MFRKMMGRLAHTRKAGGGGRAARRGTGFAPVRPLSPDTTSPPPLTGAPPTCRDTVTGSMAGASNTVAGTSTCRDTVTDMPRRTACALHACLGP